ncbi:hypothetical protein MRX96_029390 [Rhipicephalus microplus]
MPGPTSAFDDHKIFLHGIGNSASNVRPRRTPSVGRHTTEWWCRTAWTRATPADTVGPAELATTAVRMRCHEVAAPVAVIELPRALPEGTPVLRSLIRQEGWRQLLRPGENKASLFSTGSK